MQKLNVLLKAMKEYGNGIKNGEIKVNDENKIL